MSEEGLKPLDQGSEGYPSQISEFPTGTTEFVPHPNRYISTLGNTSKRPSPRPPPYALVLGLPMGNIPELGEG